MDGIRQQLLAEGQRRFGGMPPSNVGLSPNLSTSTNPLSLMQNNAMPEAGNITNGAQGALKAAMPNEAQTIIKALIKRLNENNPENPRPQGVNI